MSLFGRRWGVTFMMLLSLLLLYVPLNAQGEVTEKDFNSAPGRFNSIKAGDIDRDGRIELVYGDYDGYVTVLEYMRGDFFVDWTYEVGGDRVWGVALGDVNGDGEVEIVAGNGMGKIFVLSGKGPEELWRYEGDGRDAHGIVLHDFTGDGVVDIVVGTSYKNDDPNGMFYIIEYGKDKPFFRTEKDNSRWRGIDVGDVDGDGEDEIVVGCGAALGDVSGEGYIRVFNVTNNTYDPGNGTYGKPEWTSPDLGGCVQGLAVRDVDNDGIPNIVASAGYRYRDGWVYIFQYNVQNEDYEQLYKSGNMGPKPYGFMVEDVDNDDVYEIIVGNQPGYIYIIDGRTRKTEWKSKALGTDVFGITAIDIDSDPQLEIVAAQGGYRGKGDYTSSYSDPHIYIIDGKTHEIELILGEKDMVRFGLQIALLVLVILFLIEISVLTKLIRKKRRERREK